MNNKLYTVDMQITTHIINYNNYWGEDAFYKHFQHVKQHGVHNTSDQFWLIKQYINHYGYNRIVQFFQEFKYEVA